MPEHRTVCVSDDHLRDLVDERLDPGAEASVLRHIDACATCQARLEDVTANAREWARAQRQLEGPSVLPDVDREASSEREGDRDMRELQKHFGPTDDPTKLGRLGRYEVVGFVGKGSTGVVLKAYEPQLGRYVAIKVLSPSFSSNGPARKRFQRESRAIAAVSHEHVVPVFAVDEHGGLPFIVMQYASGGSLQQRVDRNGPLDACEVMRIGIQVARGLAEAHGQGIVHRDVKPANVMLEGEVDRAMVTDFGLARVADEAAMTRSGVVAGTPQYMSPEQARGEPVDPRSDLFSLGSVLYTACTGHSPFRAESVFGVIKRVCDDDPRPIRELAPDVDPWLADFIGKLMEKDADDRFDSATEVADLLVQELAPAQTPPMLPAPERAWRAAPDEAAATDERRRWSIPLAGTLAAGLVGAGAAIFAFTGDGADDGADGDGGDRRMARAGLWTTGVATLVQDGDRASNAQSSNAQSSNAQSSNSQSPKAQSPNSQSPSTPSPTGHGPDDQELQVREPIVEVESVATFDLEQGGSLVVESVFESIHLHPLDSGRAHARVVRYVATDDPEAASAVAERHSIWVVDDEKELLTLECELDEGVEAGQDAALRNVVLHVWAPRACEVDVRTKSGNVELGPLSGKVLVHARSGSIRADSIQGDAELLTLEGNVEVRSGTGALVATATSGNLVADLSSPRFESCRLSSSSGNVSVVVREGDPLSVAASTQSGVISDPEGNLIVSGRWRYDLAGGGREVVVRTDSGMVSTRFFRPEPEAADAPPIEDGRAAPVRVGVPDVADVPDVVIIEVADAPDAPEVADVADAPEVADVPELPELPGPADGPDEEPADVELEEIEVAEPVEVDDVEIELVEEESDVSMDVEAIEFLDEDPESCPTDALEDSASKDPAPGTFGVVHGRYSGDVIDGYALYLPISYSESQTRYPVIVSLAGGCYVGGRIDAMLESGLPAAIVDRLEDGVQLSREYDRLLLDGFVVVAPHMTDGTFEERQYYDQSDAIAEVLDEVATRYRTDTTRTYVTGAGRGGHGTWGLASRMPERFAAAVPLRGQRIGITSYAKLATVPIWAGHLEEDSEVAYAHTRDAVKAIEELGGESFTRLSEERPSDGAYLRYERLFTTYCGDGWPNLYRHPELYRWLLKHDRPALGTDAAAPEPAPVPEERFR